jgi:hypothetical protein
MWECVVVFRKLGIIVIRVVESDVFTQVIHTSMLTPMPTHTQMHAHTVEHCLYQIA